MLTVPPVGTPGPEYGEAIDDILGALLEGEVRAQGAEAYASEVLALAGTDSGAALNVAMAAAKAAGVPLVMRGFFKSSETLFITGDIEASGATIIFVGDATEPAYRIAFPGADPGQGHCARAPRVSRPTRLWGPNAHAGDVGVSIRYSLGNEIHIPFISGFSTGLLWDPEGADYACADNNVHIGYIQECLISEDVAPGSGGYCNHNNIYGGIRELALSNGRRVPGSRFIRISDADSQVGGNVWHGPELQGSAAEAALETWGINNRLNNPEIEQTDGGWVITGAVISGTTTISVSDDDLAAGMAFNAEVDGGLAISGAGIPAGTTLVAGGFSAPNAAGYSKSATLSQACSNGTITATVTELAVVMWRSGAEFNVIDLPTGGSTPFIHEIRDDGVAVKDNRVRLLGLGSAITERGMYDYYGDAGSSHWESGGLGYGTGTPQKGVHVTPSIDLDEDEPIEASVGVAVNDGVHNRRAKLFIDEDAGVFGIMATYSSGAPKFVVAIGNDEYIRIDPSVNSIHLGKAGQQIAFLGAAGAARATITGSRGGDTDGVLGQLLAALSAATGNGLITDSTTA